MENPISIFYHLTLQLLKSTSYKQAKYLNKLVNDRHQHHPLEEFPIALETPEIYRAIRDAEKEAKSIPKKVIQKKTLKMTLMEDIHGGKEDENV